MKKMIIIISALFLLTMLLLLCGCRNTPSYVIRVRHGDFYLLNELPETCRAEKKVTIKTKIPEKGYLHVYVNNKLATQESRRGDYLTYSFTMPHEDVVISLMVLSEEIKDPLVRTLIEAQLTKDHKNPFVSVSHLYGQYPSGAIAAILGGVANQAETEEIVAYQRFRYGTSNKIQVLYQGVFYSLAEAYAYGYLTKDDIIDLNNKHREIMKTYYDDENTADPESAPDTLTLRECLSEFDDLSVDTIISLEIIEKPRESVPGSFCHHTTTSDKDEITRILTLLQNAVMKRVEAEEAMTDKGTETVYSFHRENRPYTFSFSNSFVKYDNTYYRLDSLPSIEQPTATALSFLDYRNTAELYQRGKNIDRVYVTFNKLTFVIDTGANASDDPIATLKPIFGEIFLYDSRHFSYNGTRYTVTSEEDFSEIFSSLILTQ